MKQAGELLSVLCGRLGLLDVYAQIFGDLSPRVLVVFLGRYRKQGSFGQVG